MIHAKFQDHGTSGSVLEKKIFKGFYHIWAWPPSWSCDLDHLYKLLFPFPRRLHMSFGIDWPICFREDFEYNGHVHV